MAPQSEKCSPPTRWPAPDCFLGVRSATAWSDHPEVRVGHTNPPERLLEDAKFREGIATLGAMGYSFDAWLYFDQLHELTALARDLPDVSIILNHLGAPLGIGPHRDRRAEVTALWKAGMVDVASCPNVSLKVGGVGMDDLFATGWGRSTRRRTPIWSLLAGTIRCVGVLTPSDQATACSSPIFPLIARP